MSARNGFQRKLPAFMVLAVSVLLVLVFQQARKPIAINHLQDTKTPVQDVSESVVKRVAVPFGYEQPHNFTTLIPDVSSPEPVRIRKRALSFFEAICKGEKHLSNIAKAELTSTEPGTKYTVKNLEDGGWTLDSTYPLRIPTAMLPALKACGVDAGEGSNQVRYAKQNKDYESVGGDTFVRQILGR